MGPQIIAATEDKGGSQAVVVDTLRSLIVVVRTGHVPLAQTLVYYKDDFGRNLCTEEGCFVEADLLPLRKVLWRLDHFDVCRGLAVCRVCVLGHTRHERITTVWSKMLCLSCSGGEKERVYLRATVRAELGLRRVRTCACRS